jgi:hypothetical protein
MDKFHKHYSSKWISCFNHIYVSILSAGLDHCHILLSVLCTVCILPLNTWFHLEFQSKLAPDICSNNTVTGLRSLSPSYYCCGVRRKARVFLSGNRWCPDGIFGLVVHLGTNRLVIVRCGLLDRETVELNTIHPDTSFISLETILYTLLALQKHCRSSWYTLSILQPEPKYLTCTCLCTVDKNNPAPSPPEHWPPLRLSYDPLGRWLLCPNFYCSTLGRVTRLQKHPQGSNVMRLLASEFELLCRVHPPISHNKPPHRMH